MPELSFIEKYGLYVQSSCPFVWIQTHEEQKVCREIVLAQQAITQEKKKGHSVLEWDSQNGLTRSDSSKSQPIRDTKSAIDLLNYLHSDSCLPNQIFLVKDFHPFLENPIIVRSLRNLVAKFKTKGSTFTFISPVIRIPIELDKEIKPMEYALPSEAAIADRFDFIYRSGNKDGKIAMDVNIRAKAIEAAKGMTSDEVESTFALALVQNKKYNQDYVDTVFSEKVTQVKRSGLLTYMPPDVSFDNIGGLTGLKKWIRSRGKAYELEARDYGLPFPRGILLCGIAGGGKSLLAKATSRELNMPLFQLDIGSLFGKLVGETEQNFRRVIQVIDGVGTCILFIDEIEKSLNKSAVSGAGDSGTSSRSFGTFLTWLSDHKTPVFVIGTSNNFTILPTELIRKGRFDELWWIDLPTDSDRQDIFNIIFTKYNRKSEKFNIPKLVGATAGFTGAEMENCFISAMYNSYSASRREVDTNAILAEVEIASPLSKIHSADLDRMRKEAEGKLRIAANDGTAVELGKEYRSISM